MLKSHIVGNLMHWLNCKTPRFVVFLKVLILRIKVMLLFCQPRVEVTSCFVYKVMGLTFHDRINTQLIYRIAVAQVVTRITKPQRTFF